MYEFVSSQLLTSNQGSPQVNMKMKTSGKGMKLKFVF